MDLLSGEISFHMASEGCYSLYFKQPHRKNKATHHGAEWLLTTQNRPWRNIHPIARFEGAAIALEEFVTVQKSMYFNGLQRVNGTV